MLVGSEQFTLNHSSLLDSGKITGYNWFGCFVVNIGSLEVTFQVFPSSEECSSNMMGSKLNNNQINEIIIFTLGVLPGEPVMTPVSKLTHRAHMDDFTCPLRSSYAVIPSDHQSTEKE